MTSTRKFSYDDYTVAWICALPVEMAAARLMVDEIHDDLPVPSYDQNVYTLGRTGKHGIVIACLPNGEYGIASATAVPTQPLATFHSIRFGLMVGIGGGIPNSNADIRLGDVVVGKPIGTHGGVVQYDYGKALNGGRFERTGMLNQGTHSKGSFQGQGTHIKGSFQGRGSTNGLRRLKSTSTTQQLFTSTVTLAVDYASNV